MRHNLLRRLSILAVVTLMTVAAALAQGNSALVGKWNMVSETDGGAVNWILVLKEADGKLTGALSTGEQEAPAKDFTYENGVLKFKAPYQGEYYDIELKLAEAKLDGTWSGGGGSGRTHGSKSS